MMWLQTWPLCGGYISVEMLVETKVAASAGFPWLLQSVHPRGLSELYVTAAETLPPHILCHILIHLTFKQSLPFLNSDMAAEWDTTPRGEDSLN